MRLYKKSPCGPKFKCPCPAARLSHWRFKLASTQQVRLPGLHGDLLSLTSSSLSSLSVLPLSASHVFLFRPVCARGIGLTCGDVGLVRHLERIYVSIPGLRQSSHCSALTHSLPACLPACLALQPCLQEQSRPATLPDHRSEGDRDRHRRTDGRTDATGAVRRSKHPTRGQASSSNSFRQPRRSVYSQCDGSQAGCSPRKPWPGSGRRWRPAVASSAKRPGYGGRREGKPHEAGRH